jgi:hypothetical protein
LAPLALLEKIPLSPVLLAPQAQPEQMALLVKLALRI